MALLRRRGWLLVGVAGVGSGRLLNASVSSRNSMRAAIPFSAPSRSDITRSSEAARKTLHLFSNIGHEAMICSLVQVGSPHGHDGSSAGTKEE